MIFNPMHSPPPKREYEGEVWECWRTRSNAAIHLVASEVGELDDHTACGIMIHTGWDHGSSYGNAADWHGCRRCEAAYRAWAKKQKKVSANHE